MPRERGNRPSVSDMAFRLGASGRPWAFRVGPTGADFLQRQLAQNVGMALAVSSKINDFRCDCLPNIVVAVAEPERDANRFEREAHHADCLVVELFAVEEGPNRHAHLPPRGYPKARRRDVRYPTLRVKIIKEIATNDRIDAPPPPRRFSASTSWPPLRSDGAARQGRVSVPPPLRSIAQRIAAGADTLTADRLPAHCRPAGLP